jgi:hypothetical protein
MRLFWPEQEVLKYLKGRSRYVSLTKLDEDAAWVRGRREILFAENESWREFVSELAERVPKVPPSEPAELDSFKKTVQELATKARDRAGDERSPAS